MVNVGLVREADFESTMSVFQAGNRTDEGLCVAHVGFETLI